MCCEKLLFKLKWPYSVYFWGYLDVTYRRISASLLTTLPKCSNSNNRYVLKRKTFEVLYVGHLTLDGLTVIHVGIIWCCHGHLGLLLIVQFSLQKNRFCSLFPSISNFQGSLFSEILPPVVKFRIIFNYRFFFVSYLHFFKLQWNSFLYTNVVVKNYLIDKWSCFIHTFQALLGIDYWTSVCSKQNIYRIKYIDPNSLYLRNYV